MCKGCLLGKHAKATFPHSETRSKGVLDLVHLDVCGPMLVDSITRFSYFVTFIDDYSRRKWIYLLKVKYEVFSLFQGFTILVHYHTGKKIMVLRSDNGGEYTSSKFKGFYREVGINRELTVLFGELLVEWACREEESMF